jgi:carbon monoxide dehydrogenase subunit G
LRLENAFRVPASVEQAWRLLNDVPNVVPCMPGAELTEVVGENAWKTTMHVKLGPIALQFLTDVTREEADEAARRVVLSARAREARGRGGAQARIESTLAEEGGETAVAIVTDLTLQGAVAQYGRGIVGDVAAQLTKQFADCLAGRLTREPDPAPPAPVGKPVAGLPLLWRALLGVFRTARR